MLFSEGAQKVVFILATIERKSAVKHFQKIVQSGHTAHGPYPQTIFSLSLSLSLSHPHTPTPILSFLFKSCITLAFIDSPFGFSKIVLPSSHVLGR